MTRRADESGFTLIEVLVSILLFAIVGVGFYEVMVSSTRGANTTRNVVRVSENARLGFNRMIRDTREAREFGFPTPADPPNVYNVKVDFDGDGNASENPNEAGDYEDLTFKYIATDKVITLNGEVLIEGVERIPDGATSRPIFSYASNALEYDANGNGVTEQSEIDSAAGVGNNSGVLDTTGEIALVTSVQFAFRVNIDGRFTDFIAQAQIRNRR